MGGSESQGGSESHGIEVTWGGQGHTVGIGVIRGSRSHRGMGSHGVTVTQGGQGHIGLKVTWRGWGHMRGLGSHGGRQAAQGMGCDSPTPWSHLSIGGHQYFRPPVQIDVGDQATEDTVKLVTARQEKLVFEPPAQQVAEGQNTAGRLGSSAVPATPSTRSSRVRSGGSVPAEAWTPSSPSRPPSYPPRGAQGISDPDTHTVP